MGTVGRAATGQAGFLLLEGDRQWAQRDHLGVTADWGLRISLRLGGQGGPEEGAVRDTMGSREEPRGRVTPEESLAETLRAGPSRRPVWPGRGRGQGGSARRQGGH